MIHMHAHPEWMVLSQHGAQLRRDALRQEHRHARPDPNKLDVRNLAKPGENLLELAVAEKQSIPPAQQDIAHFGVRFQVTKSCLKFGMQFLLTHTADDAATSAIPAVAGTSIRH